MARLNLPQQRRFIGPARAWKRVVAFMIDFLILDLFVFWPFENIFSKMIPVSDLVSLQRLVEGSSEAASALIAASIAMGLITIVYFIVLERRLGQSIGKMLMNIHVISEIKAKEKTTSNLMLWQCLVRSIIWIPVFPFLLFWVIDPAYALFNQKRQRLFELMSRTSTIEVYAYNPYPTYYDENPASRRF